MTLDDTVLDQMAALVRAHPQLPTAEVETLLAGARAAGEGSERDTLCRHHMVVALDIALARRGRDDDVAELFQEANVAVVAAVGDYAAGTGAAEGLLPYVRAAAEARVEALQHRERRLREEQETFISDTRLLDLAQVALGEKLERPPTVEELAEVLTWEPERVALLGEILEGARGEHDRSLIPYLDDTD